LPTLAGRGFRPGLRVKGVRGAAGIFEMTWADDGRATFEYGDAIVANDPTSPGAESAPTPSSTGLNHEDDRGTSQ
jgi:hypothetical protein